jgi:hypothetical protein
MGVHIWGSPDSFCTQHTADILEFYGSIEWIPTTIWDGKDYLPGGYDWDYSNCRAVFNKRKAINAPLSISLSGWVTGDTATVNAAIYYPGGPPLPTFIKLTAAESKKLAWPSASVPLCDSLLYIHRDVVPNTAGDSLMLSHGVANTTFTMPLDPGWNRNELNFIVYAENRITKDIYQTSQIAYNSLTGMESQHEVAAVRNAKMIQIITPNPTRSGATISYTLATEQPVSLSIYDIMGRKICRIITLDRQSAGKHQIKWTGKDESGLYAPSGTYFSLFETPNGSSVARFTLLK